MDNIAQPTNKIKKNFWLVKFAPFRTSWRDIIKTGSFTLRGVRSNAARKNLIAMRSGDRALFYHSQEEKAIVGILKIIRESYPDPTSSDPRWMTCDFAPIKSFSRPVPLKEMRSYSELAELPLLRQPRLSVMPVSRNHYELIIRLSEESETDGK